jgi:peptidoglycan hydrolase CwlO-like protein
MKSFSVGLREVLVGAIIVVIGGVAHQLVTTYAVNKAFAQHTANAEIHQDQDVLVEKLSNLKEDIDKNEHRWDEQRAANNKILEELGRLQRDATPRPSPRP